MIRSNIKVLMAKMEQEQGRRMSYDLIHEKTGLARNTIANLAAGKSSMVSFDTLDRLCAYFDVGVGDLLVYVPDPAVSRDGRDGHGEPQSEAVPDA